MPTLPATPDHLARYWESVGEGRLTFPRCHRCGHAWLPASNECPACLVADWSFETASGEATLLSWVVYHHAYHPKWADRLPYTVALVQLAEGPRMMSNIVGVDDPEALVADQPLRLVFQDEAGTTVPRFTTIEGNDR